MPGYQRRQENGVRRYLHRIVWEEAHGPIPDGMEVMHTCDEPGCVDLDHLRLGTHAENMADMRAKGRGRWWGSNPTHCKHGHEYTPENTLPTKTGRKCRTCKRESERRRNHACA